MKSYGIVQFTIAPGGNLEVRELDTKGIATPGAGLETARHYHDDLRDRTRPALLVTATICRDPSNRDCPVSTIGALVHPAGLDMPRFDPGHGESWGAQYRVELADPPDPQPLPPLDASVEREAPADGVAKQPVDDRPRVACPGCNGTGTVRVPWSVNGEVAGGVTTSRCCATCGGLGSIPEDTVHFDMPARRRGLRGLLGKSNG